MFEFLDAILSYTESNPEVSARVEVSEGNVDIAFLYHGTLGIGEYVNSIEELDAIDWSELIQENLKEQLDELDELLKGAEITLAVDPKVWFSATSVKDSIGGEQ